MFRPFIALGTLAVVAFLFAPTVESVHDAVEELGVQRDLPWRIWKWTDEPSPSFLPPGCDRQEYHLYSEVTEWPRRTDKAENVTIGGVVLADETAAGVGNVEVDLFLNETKDEEGIHLGTVETDHSGQFTLTRPLPEDLVAETYHLVAHAKERREGCTIYHEHWSDPEMDVTSASHIMFDNVTSVVVAGHNVTINGTLVDAVEAPIPNQNITLRFEGETTEVPTDATGRFSVTLRPATPGEQPLQAAYDGNRYYDDDRETLELDVRREHVFLDGNGGDHGLEVVRSRAFVLSGDVVVPPGAETRTVDVHFDGVRVATCPDCEPSSTLELETDADGVFARELFVPASEPRGPFSVIFRGGALEGEVAHNGTVFVASELRLDAAGAGFFSRAFEGTAHAVDDAGEPLPGNVTVAGPDSTVHAGMVGAAQPLVFEQSTSCGTHDLAASYSDTPEYVLPSTAETTVGVCAFLAYIPGWVLATPWWVFVLVPLVGLAAWYGYRGWRQRAAAFIDDGPPLTLRVVTPDDAAAEVLAVGERATLAATLEGPLPDGHRLRVGTPTDMREVALEADLTAHHTVHSDEIGEIPVRADITDAKGRVVSRRTVVVRVVRYAEEIERRYLALRKRRIGRGSASVSPREFERWLAERSPELDPAVARRLVGVFEEADYGPREVARRELLAYVDAEDRLPEVKARAR